MDRNACDGSSGDTVGDFSAQWTRYTDNAGYYGSLELLFDIAAGFLSPGDLAGKDVADIGSGTGRIVNMLLDAGARRVIAIEPSRAFDVLVENTRPRAAQIEYIHGRGEELNRKRDLDLVVSFGVLHHIEQPAPVVRAAFEALKPGGRMIVWLYGHEGNELYLRWSGLLRRLTVRMPDRALAALCWILDICLDPYILACRLLPLPLRSYLLSHYSKLSRRKRRLTIFDQLNPSYAKYYREAEAIELLTAGGFGQVEARHRHGYSWTVCGVR